ncbi:MAG: hypothetical protein C5B59_10290 [Bacteroidetes bacterium]|nr:MAG: hypothetical protein C5B59_10290 [Bacteroidota bacterium]
MINSGNKMEFVYQGDRVEWIFKEMNFVTQPDLRAQVICDHPAFTSTFGSSSMTGDSLRSIVAKGKSINPSFFQAMVESYIA